MKGNPLPDPQPPRTRVVVVLGPTASGKSAFAVNLALIFRGEIISADSRQIYRGMDIGTGKITENEMRGVPHHLLDVSQPTDSFSVAHYRSLGRAAITNISAKGHLPIVCGGTAFYIRALLEDLSIPEVQPNVVLRNELRTHSTSELASRLSLLDPVRFSQIDQRNPVRLIRAIEIATALGSVPPLKSSSPFQTLFLGIQRTPEELRVAITNRLDARIANHMIDEAVGLYQNGLSYERMEAFGLEYRAMAQYLQGKISLVDMRENILKESIQFCKRQMTWWKHDPRIHWTDGNLTDEVCAYVTNFEQGIEDISL